MARPAYDPLETYRFKATAFPFTSVTEVDANLTEILGTAPTESVAGRLAAALTKFGDVATPVMTADMTPAQPGDKMDLLDTILEDA